MPQIWNTNNKLAGRATPPLCWWDYKIVRPLERQLKVSDNTTHTLPCDPVIMPLGTYPKELKNYVHTIPARGSSWNLQL